MCVYDCKEIKCKQNRGHLRLNWWSRWLRARPCPLAHSVPEEYIPFYLLRSYMIHKKTQLLFIYVNFRGTARYVDCNGAHKRAHRKQTVLINLCAVLCVYTATTGSPRRRRRRRARASLPIILHARTPARRWFINVCVCVFLCVQHTHIIKKELLTCASRDSWRWCGCVIYA